MPPGIGYSRGGRAVSYTHLSDIAGGKKLNDGSVWGKAVFNSAISAACAVIAGPSIANGNKELQEARAMARADQKTRNSTVGAWLSGTASRVSASAAQQAYKTSARKVRTVANLPCWKLVLLLVFLPHMQQP